MKSIHYLYSLSLLFPAPLVFGAAGSGDSAAGALDTKGPEVLAVSVTTTREAVITFDEPVTDATTAANYFVSGGSGNLTSSPDTAVSTGTNEFTVSWSSGEMTIDDTITLVASTISDAVGNPVDSSTNAGSDTTIADLPDPGSLSEPAMASMLPITIPFSGAMDTLSSVAGVELWYRFDDGSSSWTNSGLTVNADSGSFDFTPPGMTPDYFGTYFFELVAEDAAGNRSAEPSGTAGNGSGTTNFAPPASVVEWEMY